MPISLIYDAYLPCLRCLSPLFTILFCVFLMPDSRIFEPTILYGVHAWYAWLIDGRAVYSVECLRVIWSG